MPSRRKKIAWLRQGAGFFITLLFLLEGCAPTTTTLAQDLAMERWEKCQLAGIHLDHIDPNGTIWLRNVEPAMLRGEPWECLRKVADEQRQRRMGLLQIPEPKMFPAPQTAKDQPPVEGGPPVAPAWKPGYEWAFRWESPRGKGTFVWSVDREELVDGVECYVVKAGEQREIYWRKTDLAYYMDKVSGVVEERSTPAELRYAWPLETGKTWTQTFHYERLRDRTTQEIASACQVEGEETITVPAGTFRTFKIVCRSQRTGSLRHESWYSPEVKQKVRERDYFSYGIRDRELIAFRLK